jgi:hypothetical protein
MDTKASTLDPALLHLVTEMNLYGTVYSCNRTVRRWRLCPLRRSEGRYRPLHAVFGAGSRAFRDYGELHSLRRDRHRAVVEFLATDLSDYVTGAVIPIDGGLVRG